MLIGQPNASGGFPARSSSALLILSIGQMMMKGGEKEKTQHLEMLMPRMCCGDEPHWICLYYPKVNR
jgi:hypothetical protein